MTAASPLARYRAVDGALPSGSAAPSYTITGDTTGSQWRVRRRLSLFAEYKLSCSINTGRLKSGGTIHANLCSHQFLLGPIVHLRGLELAAP